MLFTCSASFCIPILVGNWHFGKYVEFKYSPTLHHFGIVIVICLLLLLTILVQKQVILYTSNLLLPRSKMWDTTVTGMAGLCRTDCLHHIIWLPWCLYHLQIKVQSKIPAPWRSNCQGQCLRFVWAQPKLSFFTCFCFSSWNSSEPASSGAGGETVAYVFWAISLWGAE